jgi:hypothetical protein
MSGPFLSSAIDRMLSALLREGRRKAVQSFGALIFLTAGAVYLHATFSEYKDGLLLILAGALGTHVVQSLGEARAKATAEAAKP